VAPRSRRRHTRDLDLGCSSVVWPMSWKARCIRTTGRMALSARWTFPHQEVLVMDRLLSGRRVLVVEDEMLVLIIIEDMPADLGCQSVTSAATVDKALALINAQVFDVALLDVNLNGNDSHPVAEALSARGVPFVYSTGNTARSLRDGYSDRPVLKKPFKFEELAAIFARLKLPPIER
jgi:CheY-like chemotaxis protein